MRATVIAGCLWTPVLACVLLAPRPAAAIEAGINVDIHQDINILPAPNGFRLVGRLESGPPVGAPAGGGWSKPPVLLDHVDGGAPGGVFPNFTLAISPDLLDPAQNWYTFQCDWSTSPGATVPYCNVRHLGVLFDVTCHNVVIDVTGGWTLNGQPLAFGLNQGFVPVPGFRVTDMAENQSIHLRNGNADGSLSPGEIEMRITQMDLFAAASRAELVDLLGPDPFRELRTGGAQAALPWIPVLADGLPISPANPWYFAPDSFFDVFLEMPTGPLTPQFPLAIPPGGFLLARERIEFTNNAGLVESRWVWEYHEAHQADLGDAPDSTNSWGVGMTTYPWTTIANFPTVYRLGSPPYGPIHWQPTTSAWLGPQVTFEDEADLPPDQDGFTNLEPPLNAADRDGADDGVTGMPLTLPHCQPATFNFLVTAGPAPVVMYLNAWFDWNRDGDWDDVLDCAGQPAPEWAVQNMLIAGLVPGTTAAYTTPPFLAWNPAADPLWMRVTLAEQPWQPSGGLGYGGAGLPAGYNFGETEDYLFQPGFEEMDACCLPDGTCQDLLPGDCLQRMGTPQGQLCTGTVEACCLPDMSCAMVDPLCCDDMGGIRLGAGTVCAQPEACCTPDASTCLMADPLCCLAAQGIPQGAGTVCTAPQACCLPDGTCADVDPLCCDDLGGVPGFAANCLGDLNANGVDDACEIPTVFYPKWQQPPHDPGHGFDAPSALWLHDQAPAPLPELNIVVADDFISDGRPIRSLRWWGSYFDERYLPDAGQDPLHRLDGWLISFHHAEPQVDPQCPPDFLAGDPPPTALAVYFAPASAVESLPLGWLDCLGHPVYEHRIDLRNCCLVCFEPDPRNGLIPATPLAFNEVHSFGYWLDIQAVTGAEWLPLSVDACELVYTGHLPSDQTADGVFWGWHTSRLHRLQEACTGKIVPPIPTPYPTCWNYGGWMKQPWLCPPPMEPVNMAFELWTPVKRGDCTLDGIVGLADHAVLGSCLTGPIAAALAPGCECIDLDVDNDVDLRDFALFTQIFTGP